jgi:hypothetical protein
VLAGPSVRARVLRTLSTLPHLPNPFAVLTLKHGGFARCGQRSGTRIA